ncbi:uncharacterized protein EI90DRAFT_3150440 [Cantharellus anzutake]|uniref:uncharacterized protein n=1 Tax=Cantharellus anzutake TaxID=1750568 RepID=UPI0019076D67|nr:uncharacterized protein EI90DRAFT_3150440 [Cantharellus anzutake]KAF8341275.1 hypothetical protein EI90DRAFT_3150440 [Cantharellus anzutake]
MPPPPFSRIALAAALLEYDNDPDDPTKPKRSAQDSAIFSHLRRSGPVPKPESVLDYDDLPEPRRSKDFLRVPLPGDDDSLFSPMESTFGVRASIDGRRSLDVLREHGEQFFQAASKEDSEEYDSDDRVDLGSWGLDSLIPPKRKTKDKPAKRPGPSRVRPASEYLDNLPNAQSPQRISYAQDAFDVADGPSSSAGPRARPTRSRTASFMNDLGFLGNASKEATHGTFPMTGRPQTSYIPSEFDGRAGILGARPHSVMDSISVPFPTSRPATPGPDFRAAEGIEDSKFAIPLPPPERLSKFDPKAARRTRTESMGSWISEPGLRENLEDRARTVSMGSRPLLGDGNDPGAMGRPVSVAPSQVTEHRRLSRMKLLRPKVLIMPSPLRDLNNVEVSSKPDSRVGEGFLETTGDRPLPAGFRESTLAARPGVRPNTGPEALGKLPTSSHLMPNSRMSLSASQLMFRNSLRVDGNYLEDEQRLSRAQFDGEKIEMYNEDPDQIEAAYRELQHPTGKLLGHNLMDALAARKDEIKGKKRVFTGDGRFSMMERSLSTRNTLIDAATFDQPQVAVVDSEGRPIKPEARKVSDGDRRKSAAPLVDLKGVGSGPRSRTVISKSRTSVFGVDTVWEREMSRLRELEEVEKGAIEQRYIEGESKAAKKTKLKGRSAGPSNIPTSPGEEIASEMPQGDSNMLMPPPTLPEVSLVTSRARPRKPKVPSSESDDEEEHGAVERRRVSTATLGVKGWFAGSSDDEDDRRPFSRNTGRFGTPPSSQAPRLPPVTGDSEDEDVPLSQIKPTATVLSRNDSDEDEPLVQTRSRLSVTPTTLLNFPEPKPTPTLPTLSNPEPTPADEEDEDDNIPLGLRVSANTRSSQQPPANAGGDDDEDETPLGLRYGTDTSPNAEQQRQQQQMSMLLVQQQQQQQAQQQMYLQHIARQSLAGFSTMTGTGMMPAGGFPTFGPPSIGMFGVASPVIPNPPVMPVVNHADSAKIGRVDAWRKGVAAEP